MKNIFRIFIILLTTLTISLCASCNGILVEYSITYYVNGEVVKLFPSSYHNTIELPKYETSDGYQFDGWYLDLAKEKQVDTTYGLSQNLVLYGYTKRVTSPLESEIKKFNDKHQENVRRGLPNIGEPNILVIPVTFSNRIIPNDLMEKTNKAFFGTSEETGWESLNSFYCKSSFGKLNIKGNVLDPFEASKVTSYYDNLYTQYLKDYDDYFAGLISYEPFYPGDYIVSEALSYYDDTVNFQDYDTDNDGYIDCIHIVYVNPFDSGKMWWAYNVYYNKDQMEVDGVKIGTYAFSSYYFFEEELIPNKETIGTDTIIHETGHALGLDDYYDYTPDDDIGGGIGAVDIMDSNIADHNSYSKAILGWIDPIIVTDDQTITINSFVETGDAIFIYKEKTNSIFGEFIAIELYTPTHLNAIIYDKFGYLDIVGVKIYHVDARVTDTGGFVDAFSMLLNNNSKTKHSLISVVEADRNNSIKTDFYIYPEDFYYEGEALTNYYWHDNTPLNFEIDVLKLENNQATIKIDFK